MPGNRNLLFMIIGALVFAAAFPATTYIKTENSRTVFRSTGPTGLKVQGK